MKTLRRLAVSCLILFTLAGSVLAQNDRQYVIQKDGHYLAHVGTTLQDATTFDPATCLWYSSNNYNYYFMDGTTKKYLKAPLALNGALSVDDDPGTQALNNSTLNFFFWDWDHGLTRGVLHLEGECPDEYNSGSGQCWEAVWVSYENNTWKMSSVYGYEPTANSARFQRVTITEHGEELSNEQGGVGNLADFAMNYQDTHALDGTAQPFSCTYTPAYTLYHIEGISAQNIPEVSYYYYGGQYHTDPPTSTTYTNATPSGYEWSLSGDGAQYLSFQDGQNQIANPTLVYSTLNNTTSHQYATLTLTVTYGSGTSQVTQTRTATVTVKIQCQNPTVLADNTVVTYVGATISWLPTADEYVVSWSTDQTTWTSVTVGNITTYTITGLEYNTTYYYKVKATCDTNDPTAYTFTTKPEPGLMITGNVFGGGRMANVGGNTEIVVINCDSIGGIYGGNDIAGSVNGANGAKITLGVNEGDVYATTYDNTTTMGATLKFGDVYGGGNGYYAYDGSSFEAAAADYTSYTVQPGESVKAMTQLHQVGDIVWTNTGSTPVTLDFPSIVKTEIRVRENYVTVDSIFGGAKNAFLTTDSGDGSLITIDGGTILAVFGGNNFGGKQGYGKHHIVVNKTTTNLVGSINNTATTGYGRDFGIRYLFGGGNKVYGSTTDVYINGGQCDTIFAGGNAADVYAANVTVNCEMQALSTDYTYGNVYSNAINTYSGGVITPDTINYKWDGFTGIYNVRALFGGNNMATFDSQLHQSVPNITLTSGSLGIVYGGGNMGDMWGYQPTTINGEDVNYGTYVKMNSPTLLVDYLYGGCQLSGVRYSTRVELLDGHVGTVYGGCNISGDVGSTRVDLDAAQFLGEDDPNPEYQKVYGGTYVVASGGVVYKNIFAGGNGFYHCVNENGFYEEGINYTDHNYVGRVSPTGNETHVILSTGATVKGNVYAGGNLASVGFNNNTASGNDNPFPKFVGLSSVRMSGGHVYGNVYGGGNMANVYGSNEVQVSGGTIDKSLYGGNDRLGTVATPISNRVLPEAYQKASDGETSLIDPKVYTYVGVTGNPTITNVYGGGNGDYAYFTSFAAAEAYTGDKETVVNCDISNLPIQQCTFVDIGVEGGDANGAHIGTVYGGGDGVTVIGFIKVFLNVQSNPIGYSNVGTIFGGNNKGALALVPDIIMLHGQVNTVYGGCNLGAMTAGGDDNAPTKTIVGELGDSFEDVGSYVRLLASYDADGEGTAYQPHDDLNVKVVDAIYGGCRMNGVTKNSLVLVEGGDFLNTLIFGGSDICGHVGGWSRVATTGGTVGKMYGGGNGFYTYDFDTEYGVVYNYGDNTTPIAEGTAQVTINEAPTCQNSGAEILGGHVGTSSVDGSIFGGGYGELTSTIANVLVDIGRDTATVWSSVAEIHGDIYGGSAFGSVNTLSSNRTTVNFLNGVLDGNVYGGGLGDREDLGNTGKNIEAKVFGQVFVNISSEEQHEDSCYIDLRNANVYGCNNTNGSPQDNVTVHVWKTAFDFDDGHDYTAETGAHPYYCIDQVFGGGNQADYLPENADTLSTKKILVYVHSCLNTIRRVFAGGNAAAATGVSTIIDGGRMDYVFGGGNGEVTPANVGYGGTNTTIKGGIIEHLFGGSNEQGDIYGTVNTLVNNESGCPEEVGEFFGGANLAALHTAGINTTIDCGAGTFGKVYGGSKSASIEGNVTFNIRGGNITEAYGGSQGVANGTAANITGDVTLNLEGGTITNSFGGSDKNGNITGGITVNVIDFETCPLNVTNVYGGGNETPYEPTSTTVGPVVNVMHISQDNGITGNVFGGGNLATVNASPIVNIGYDSITMSGYLPGDLPDTINDFHAFVSGSVFGGGNQASVGTDSICSTTINMYNGTVITGIYGGCNTTGDVTGSTFLQLIGGTIGVNDTITANVHGGGYGSATSVAGDVTINFGKIISNDSIDDIHTDNLILYGELYGGSALGNVNTNSSNTTTLNILNGIIVGAVYGGGLGDDDHAAAVNGNVQVNIGACNGSGCGDQPYDSTAASGYTGMADLIHCNVYGGNNLNGSPQNGVRVDVYKTYHDTEGNNPNGPYAINQVFGGGNASNYVINGQLAHVHIHGCDNTIWRIFGGGDAAAVYGVELIIEGGSFDFVFGGGNGESGIAANVEGGGIHTVLGGGIINQWVNGSNENGEITGGITSVAEEYCGNALVEDYFLGSNLTDYHGTVEAIIRCDDQMPQFVNLYGGCNRAQFYGNIDITIEGGVFYNVFGGSKGRLDNPNTNANEAYASNVLDFEDGSGTGGNITILVKGGTIGNLFGGCNLMGNVLGKITIDVIQDDSVCPLYLGNIYGGGNLTDYRPGYDKDSTFVQSYAGLANGTINTPEINVKRGTVGGVQNLMYDQTTHELLEYEGNVYGGGYKGDVTAYPIVNIGDKDHPNDSPVTIEGNVYGGGREGKIIGDTKVIIVPTN